MLRIAVTGKPGIGKTTLCLAVFRALMKEKRISGFITREVRENNVRKGFKLINLNTGEEKWLAHVKIRSNVRVGKYGVDIPLARIKEITDTAPNALTYEPTCLSLYVARKPYIVRNSMKT